MTLPQNMFDISIRLYESTGVRSRPPFGASQGWAVAFWGLALPFAHRSFALELGLLFFPGSPLFTQPHCLHALGSYLRIVMGKGFA